MPLFTVRQMLADIARPILVAATADGELAQAKQSVAASAIPVIDGVLSDLNAQNVIPNVGRRNAAVTNLQDQCVVPLGAVDQVHVNFSATRLYNAVDAIRDARRLISLQVPQDEVTY